MRIRNKRRFRASEGSNLARIRFRQGCEPGKAWNLLRIRIRWGFVPCKDSNRAGMRTKGGLEPGKDWNQAKIRTRRRFKNGDASNQRERLGDIADVIQTSDTVQISIRINIWVLHAHCIPFKLAAAGRMVPRRPALYFVLCLWLSEGGPNSAWLRGFCVCVRVCLLVCVGWSRGRGREYSVYVSVGLCELGCVCVIALICVCLSVCV